MTGSAGAAFGETATAEFDALAVASANILRSNPDPALLANPYLHPRNTHPATLALYAPFLAGLPEPSMALSSALAGLRALANALRDACATQRTQQVEGPLDFLFVSHLLRPEQLQTGQDLYYADLPTRLGSYGLRSGVALIDHTGLSPAAHASQGQLQDIPRFLLPRAMSFGQEIKSGLALRKSGRRLRQWRSGAAGDDAIASRAAAHAGSGTARAALRIGTQIAQLVERTGARILVMTYEGHAWERIAMLLARRARPGLICVCYSHAVLFPQPRAMTATLGHGLDPDIVLTAGSITRKKLEELIDMKGTSVGVLGSVRRGAPIPTHDLPPRCLVLPEGLISESLPLVEVTIEAAKLLPHIAFRLRLHPVLSQKKLLEAAPQLQVLPSNVEWSDQGPLIDDLSSSRWLLYRGSSAVFQGVEAGLKPFYLDLPQDLSPIDPLQGLAVWRSRVTSGAALAAVLQLPVDIAADNADLAVARSYCEDYFAPMNPSTLVDIASATLGNEALPRR